MSRERYWPSLLDRLLSDKGGAQASHGVDAATLRENLKRDLERLLNATALESFGARGAQGAGAADPNDFFFDSPTGAADVTPLSGFPRVRDSVLNYGVPELSGRIVSEISVSKLAQCLKDAVRRFEPRIIPETIRVKAELDGDEDDLNFDPERGLALVITGQLYGTPVEEIEIKTQWDAKLDRMNIESVH